MKNIMRIHGNTWGIFFVTLCFVAILLLVGGSVCNADDPPAGSYKNSCNTIIYDTNADKITSAHCKRKNGSWNNSANHSNCQQCIDDGGDLANCDGNIDCINVNLPDVGSYKNSCWCCRMDGTTLRCHCNKSGGGSNWTGLSNANSYDNIWNDNGTLKGKNNPPAGSYNNSCNNIFYNKDVDRITSASCRRKNGSWNNAAQHFNCQQCINAGGDLANCDGNIDCINVNLPEGSYKNSCWCCRMVGNSLGCHCNKPGGGSNWTILNNANTYTNIWNDKGTLKGGN